MSNQERKTQCVGCGEYVEKEKLERVGLVWLCPYCIAEAEARQSLQSGMAGNCEDEL